MRRCLGIAAAVLLLASCTAWPLVPRPDDGNPVRGTEVLRVGTSGDYAPFNLGGRGFDIDVAHALAAELGYASVVFVPFRWPDLAQAIATNRFDVAMSGVTWRPDRASIGYMSRAVAAGGPCVYGKPDARTVAVNRGGFLERWARDTLVDVELRAVDHNVSLPALLARGEVGAIVTDSFELAHFEAAAPGGTGRCEPKIHRKVYWLSPGAASLGPRIDRFLREHEPEVRKLRDQHFGAVGARDDVDHLVDLIARRLAFMPAVARWKAANARVIEDRARERVVVERGAAAACRAGLDRAHARGLFEVQIEIAKAIQRRTPDGIADLDLARIRPVLLTLGDRMLAALAPLAPLAPEALSEERLAVWDPLLDASEQKALRDAILAIRPTESRGDGATDCAVAATHPTGASTLQ